MRYSFIVSILLLLLLCGCGTLPYLYDIGKEGYTSPEGTAVREATELAVKPFADNPWPTIVGSIISLIAGGYAVHKRRQYLDKEPEHPSD